MSISNESRGRIKQIFEPIALAMGRMGLTPEWADADRVRDHRGRARSWSALQAWLIGGLVVFVGGVFDMFDGTLARATGKASKFGAFMDSTFDKAGEILVFLGCIVRAGELERRVGAGAGRRRRHGCSDHGQLHAGEVRRPRLFTPAWAWRPSASCPARSAS